MINGEVDAGSREVASRVGGPQCARFGQGRSRSGCAQRESGEGMETTADELRRAGVGVARTQEGFDLPVIDVTHPRFALADNADSVRALRGAAIDSDRKYRRVPAFAMR